MGAAQAQVGELSLNFPRQLVSGGTPGIRKGNRGSRKLRSRLLFPRFELAEPLRAMFDLVETALSIGRVLEDGRHALAVFALEVADQKKALRRFFERRGI